MTSFPKWMKVLIVLLLLALLAGGSWFYKTQERATRGKAEEQLRAIGRLKVEEITQWREEQVNYAAAFAENPSIALLAADCIGEPEDRAAEQTLLNLFQNMRNHYGYSDIMLVDPAGREFLTLSGKKNIHTSCIRYLKDAFRSGLPIITDLLTDPLHPQPHIATISPVFNLNNDEKSPLAAIVFIDDASRFLFPYIKSWPVPSKTAETLLVRREGDNVLFLNELRHQKDTVLKLTFPLTRTDSPAVMAVLGRTGIVQGKDYRDKEVLSYIQSIPDSNWFLISKEDAKEIYAVWKQTSMLIGALISIVFSALFVFVITMWQYKEKTHYRNLFDAQDALRESEERFRSIFENTTIGLYRTTPGGKILMANPATVKMLGYESFEELAQRNIDKEGYEQSNIRDLFKESVEKDGEISGFESSWKRKDGTTLFVRESARCVKGDTGKPLYYEGSAEDITDRKKAEETAQRERAFFDLLVEAAQEGITISDTQGRVMRVNFEFTRIFGYGVDEVVGQDIDDLVAPPEWHKEAREITKTTGQGGATSLETVRRRKDGTLIDVSLITAPIVIDGKQVAGYGIYRDISERKKSEEALIESQVKYQAIFEATGTATLIVEEDTTIEMANNECLPVTGYSPRELVGMKWPRFVAPDSLEMMIRYHKMRREEPGKAPSQYEVTLINKDGKHRNAILSIAIIPDSGKSVVSMLDITERKQAEGALRKSEEKYRGMFECVQDVYFETSIEGIILEVSPSIEGFSKGQFKNDALIGKSMYDFYDVPGDRDILTALLTEKGHVMDYEVILKNRDGSQIPCSIAAKIQFSAQGVPLKIIGSMHDITERKRSEKKLKEQIEELQRWNNATLNREGRILDLKREVNDLLGKVGHPPRYRSAETEG